MTDTAAPSTGPQPKPWIEAIHAYVPGKSAGSDGRKLIKLSANENPLGTSPAALAAREQAALPSLYPDPNSNALREAIGELAEAGLLSSKAGSGVFVAEVLGSAFSPALVRLFASHEALTRTAQRALIGDRLAPEFAEADIRQGRATPTFRHPSPTVGLSPRAVPIRRLQNAGQGRGGHWDSLTGCAAGPEGNLAAAPCQAPRVMVHCSGSSRDEDREATMVATTAAVAATVTVVVTTKVTSTAV